MAIVYLETNLVVGLTLGQEPEGETLLREADRKEGLQLAIPAVCLMEAVMTIRRRLADWEALHERLRNEMGQLERSQASPDAQRLLERLADARLMSGEYIEGIMSDFRTVIRRVGSIARLIPLKKSTLDRGLPSIIVEARRPNLILPDNLILHCILDHARSQPGATKALLSGNHREFGRPEIQAALKGAGIDKYFTDAKNAVGWYRSRPVS